VARRYHQMERFMGSFAVEVELPKPVDPRQARARLEQGVLTIVLPVLVDKRHRVFRIPISEEPD
jgi:HSP20 family molecular chaperone IbpA